MAALNILIKINDNFFEIQIGPNLFHVSFDKTVNPSVSFGTPEHPGAIWYFSTMFNTLHPDLLTQ